LILRINTP